MFESLILAQITPTVPTVVIEQQLNDYQVTGGDQKGANLFHTFEELDLESNQSLDFLVPAEVQNLFNRVTGGNFSYIDGRLTVTGGSPNFFLINPSGIVFGANAQINVPAAFTALVNGLQLILLTIHPVQLYLSL